MIPDVRQIFDLWKKYDFPENKRLHSELVAQVAIFLAEKLLIVNKQLSLNMKLLKAAALLHDIDKNIPKLSGETHPDTGVRVLKEEGMGEVAELVKSHPLHLIINPQTAPKTWEEKILFLSDKTVKYQIVTVDKRFDLWNREHMSPKEQEQLDLAYPKVKELEKEIFSLIKIKPEDLLNLI